MTPWAAPLAALAALLVGAGAAKAVRPADTARALARFSGGGGGRLDAWRAAVRAGAVLEAGVGAWALVAGGRWAAAAVAMSYGGFALFVGAALRSGSALASCGCFGEPDTPPTAAHALACAAGSAVAAVAAVRGPVPGVAAALSRLGAGAPAFVLLSAALAYGAYLLMASRPRLAAAQSLIRSDPSRLRGGSS